jgi:molecular chaperone HtpG
MSSQTRKFDAEVGKVLNLMIHSLYTNKEIFLRELISNASDACDKLRYLSLSEPSLIDGSKELRISITLDKDQRLIIVRDNGIGMNEQDLIENLGTVARSGTQIFAEKLSGDAKKDSALIGQFGVGFYSSFMVAEKVVVTSKKAGEDKTYRWESNGDGEYIVSEAVDLTSFDRGTEIVLHVKDQEESYLDHFRLKHIVKSYSDHVIVPIYFIGDQGTETKVNSSSALWTRNKTDITEQQYKEFYKTVSYAADEPWLTIHNKNEGTTEFTNLLFIPSNKTFDLFHPDRKRRVKLYIKRVFISDENIELIPHYMRFLRGVVDSEDLPLNISRETLQHNSVLDKIRNAITKKVLNELIKKKQEARDEYISFWDNFGAVLKEGLCEAGTDYQKLLEACLFHSVTHDKQISLDEYIAECKSDKKVIYYLSGENPTKLASSPQIEGFRSRGIDVLLFTDSVDDFWVNVNGVYKDYEIKSVTRSDIDLGDHKQDSLDKQEIPSESDLNEQNKLTEYFKKILADSVVEVKISKKLTSSPACLAVAEGSMDIRMERFLIEQKQLARASAKILELNQKHPVINKIAKDLAHDLNNDTNGNLVKLIFDQACILEGEPVTDATDFAARLTALMQARIC